MKRAFVGCIHGGELPEGSVSGGETAIYSDGESSMGKTYSLYQLQDGRIGAVPMATIFRTLMIRQTGLEYSWPVHTTKKHFRDDTCLSQ